MVQVLSAREPKKTFAQKLNIGIGKGLESANEMYKEYQKESKEQKSKKEMVNFADQLESSNPDSPAHKTIANIYRLDIPTKDKSEMVKGLMGIDPFKVEQQKRLQMDSILKRYTNKLKEINDELKNMPFKNTKNKERYDQLNTQRLKLIEEKDSLLEFKSLNMLGDEEEIEQEIDVDEELDTDYSDDFEEPKIKFDPSNEKHQAVARKLYETLKDKEKVREELKKKFTGI